MKSRIPVLSICLLSIFCLSSSAALAGNGQGSPGRTWFVSVDGSDENAGTADEPFRTISRAAGAAGPGETVRVSAGRYAEAVVFPRSGDEGAPIIFEGERGPAGEWLTILDNSAPVSGWEPAPEVGEGVFKAQLGFNPGCITLGGRMLARVNDGHMRREPGDVRGGLNLLAIPAGDLLNNNERVPAQLKGRYLVDETGFWDGLKALYGTRDGVTYIRFRDGDDPREMELLAAPEGAGFVLDNRAHIVIRDFLVRGAQVCVEISGEGAFGNIIENNRLTHGRMRVFIRRGAARNIIRGNEMTLDYFGHDRPGAWGTSRPTVETSLAGFVYRTFKYVVGGNSSDDRAVEVQSTGEGNEIYGNHIHGGLIGINSAPSNGLVFRDNVIHDMSSIGLSVPSGTLDALIHDNLVYNCNINLRIHNMNHPTAGGHRIYLFRNRFFLPPGIGKHIHSHPWHEEVDSPHPLEITFYHNSLAGGGEGIAFVSRFPELPGFRFLNNAVATGTSVRSVMELLENPDRVGVFDYNWLGGPNAGYRGEPAWFGGNNIIARGEDPWPGDDIPDFRFPPGHAAFNAGLDLSRPFTYRGREHGPLPGMEPGYFEGERPDIGAIQHGREVPLPLP